MKKIPYYLLALFVSIAYVGCENFDAEDVTEVLHEITAPGDIEQAQLVEEETLVEEEKIEAVETETVQEPEIIQAVEPETIIQGITFESGTISVSQDSAEKWTAVTFSTSFDNPPIVVLGPTSSEGDDPHTLRVRNITKDGFELKLHEWDYLDGPHKTVNISYLAVKSGTYTLGDLKVSAFQITLDHNWSDKDFPEDFESTPVVLSQITSYNGTQPATLRTKSVTPTGFTTRIQEEEGNDDEHAEESVDIIAIKKGNTTYQDKKIIVSTQDDVEESLVTVNFGESMSNPTILAAMQTTNGTDPATLRYDNLSNSSVDLFVQEEESGDDETDHVKEKVGWVAISDLIGGSGGNAFSDNTPQEGTKIAAIRVRSGWGLDAIQVIYTKEKHRHGGAGGGEQIFMLQEDEYITKISGKANNYVGSIQFHTNKGRTSNSYGTAQGQWAGTDFTLEAPAGKQIAGFRGRSGSYIDAIGIVVSPADSLASTEGYGDLVGGSGGSDFSDEAPQEDESKVAGVRVRSGWGLDAIQILYAKGEHRHGGGGGGENAFTLKEDEYLTKISGKAGSYIGSIQFHTNEGRASDSYGTAQGQWAGTDFTLEAPANKKVVGFKGRSGSYIDAIGIRTHDKD